MTAAATLSAPTAASSTNATGEPCVPMGAGDLDGEAGLADPARPDQGHHPLRRDQLDELIAVGVAAYQ